MASAAGENFARRLRELRLARGFAKARYFAEALGISENRYTRYERAGAEPEFELVVLFCEKLGVTPNELFGVDGGVNDGVLASRPPGFGEQAAGSGNPPMRTAPGRGASVDYSAGQQRSVNDTARPTDLLGWRLAEQIARMRVEAGGAPVDSLDDLRQTGQIFVDLKSDPFGTVAYLLADAAVTAQEERVKERLGREIKRFLRTIERGTVRA